MKILNHTHRERERDRERERERVLKLQTPVILNKSKVYLHSNRGP